MARKSATSSSDFRRPRSDARRLIAERAARLIIDGGLSDWSLAKRKAARQLGLTDARALPDHDEITTALYTLQELFHADRHPAQLRAKRTEALEWMRQLAQFAPALVGGVAEGWGTEHGETRIELTADSAKEVEFALLNAGVNYQPLSEDSHRPCAEFGITGHSGLLRLVVRPIGQRRTAPAGPGNTRLDACDLEALLSDE